MLNVLADLHHQDLFYSLQLLFEKRLGYALYRPIGLDWRTQGFWKVYDHPATAAQYLGLEQAHQDMVDVSGQPLPDSHKLNKTYVVEDGVYYVVDVAKDKIQRAITLGKFKSMRFDAVISSIPQHIQPFNKLISMYQPQAKHIFQVGNCWTNLPGVKNIMASTEAFPVGVGINAVFYHQEFDLDVFKYAPPAAHHGVNGYIHYMRLPEALRQYKTLLPEFKFTTYGAGMDSNITKTSDLAAAMRDSAFTWHIKPEGDGFGHIIHNTFACGRPAIVMGSHYKGKLAGRLFEHGKTVIDLERGSAISNAALIRETAQPDRHTEMCAAAHKRFHEIVNFDAEFEQIKRFLEGLQ